MTYILQNVHYFVLLIGALVFFHELGHFLVAKACNVKVLRFSIGFGPRIFSTTRGETEYQLSLLPLGGYVKMLGDVPGSEVPAAENARAFSSKPVWQRAAILVAGPTFNMLLATSVYTVMFAGNHSFGDTRLGVITVDEPAWNAGLRPGDRVLSVEGIAVSRWDELREEIAKRPDASLKIHYERDGVPHDATLVTRTRAEENAFQESETRGKIGVSLQYLKPILAVVDPQSPAALAGLKTDDIIDSVGGKPTGAWHEVRNALAQIPAGTDVRLSVSRGAEKREVQLKPAAQPLPGLDSHLFSSADTATGYTGLVNKDSVVEEIQPNTPAASVDLQPGDRLIELTITAPDGHVTHRPVGVWNIDLASFGLDARSDLSLTWQRGSTVTTRSLHLQKHEETDDFKNVHTSYVLGATNDANVIDMYQFQRNVGPVEAVQEALGQVGDDMTLIGRGLGKMFRGNIPFNTMGGPIMLFVIAEKSAKRGMTYYFRTMAMISVNLGMINMLPIPVLDGGHLMFCLIEVVSRRPPSVRVREMANVMGLALLLFLMVMVFRNDILRFVMQ